MWAGSVGATGVSTDRIGEQVGEVDGEIVAHVGHEQVHGTIDEFGSAFSTRRCDQRVVTAMDDERRHIEVIEMGVAMAVGCYPCMTMLTGAAADKGVSEEELGTIQAIVMAVCAGRVFNQYREVCKRL